MNGGTEGEGWWHVASRSKRRSERRGNQTVKLQLLAKRSHRALARSSGRRSTHVQRLQRTTTRSFIV